MSNFASVKHLADKARRLLLATAMIMVAAFAVVPAQAQTETDSIELSLLTCTPNQRIYGLYGHTALRLHDLRTGEDWAFNYGVFNFKTSFFALKFLFGLTDYELAPMPMKYFHEEYVRMKCRVTEQVLNLTPEEKQRMIAALNENYLPQNRVYRYNYFYDNCTTRARNMIERNLDGTLSYGKDSSKDNSKGDSKDSDGPSYREMVHEYTAQHPWAAFGNDLCLGCKADIPTTWREQQFLPERLMMDMGKAKIVSPDGKERPAVAATRIVTEGGQQTVEKEFPLSPAACAFILLVVTLAVCAGELKKRRIFRVYDALLMVLQGLSGLIVTALLFSEHPTTSTNLQILLLNPLPLAFLYKTLKGRASSWWRIETVLVLLFLAGAFVQDYAEGMEIVALCLLLRCAMHLYANRTSRIKE